VRKLSYPLVILGAFALRIIFLIVVLAVFTTLVYLYDFYRNYYLAEGMINQNNKISLLNYRELPKLVESWDGAQKLITDARFINSNSAVKKIYKIKGRYTANLKFEKPDEDIRKRTAVLTVILSNNSEAIDLNDMAVFSAVWARGNIIGNGYQRSRVQLELVDESGKVMRGPKIPLSLNGDPTYLLIRPTTSEPVPTGSVMENFNLSKVRTVSIRFIAGRYPDGISIFPAEGEMSFDNIYLVKKIGSVMKFFGRPNSERVTRDNIKVSYKFRKLMWDGEKSDFFVGINYPWNNYGWDFGKNPYGEPANAGWSANEKKLREDLTYLKKSGVEPVRMYLFFDMRTGLLYENNKLIGFDEYVRKDLEALIRIAGETKIKINLVLFDFGIADGNGNGAGEHPELIFSSEKHNFLINLMRPLLQDLEKWNKKYGEPIFALELMNEPDNMAALIIPGYFQSLKAWFQDLANIIHNETSMKVTLGSHSIVDMQRWWGGIDIDMWQFHFYKYMLNEHEKWPQILNRDDIKLDGPIFCGEMEPFDTVLNIEAVKNNGYSGLMFWSFNANDGFGMRGTKQMEEIINWIAEIKKKSDAPEVRP